MGWNGVESRVDGHRFLRSFLCLVKRGSGNEKKKEQKKEKKKSCVAAASSCAPLTFFLFPKKVFLALLTPLFSFLSFFLSFSFPLSLSVGPFQPVWSLTVGPRHDLARKYTNNTQICMWAYFL